MRRAMQTCIPLRSNKAAVDEASTMADWSLLNREWSNLQTYSCYQGQPYVPVTQCLTPEAQLYQQVDPAQTLTETMLVPPLQNYCSPKLAPTLPGNQDVIPERDNPRAIRNKAEKQRRDKLNQSISELSAIVPPVVASNRKIDKTGVLRLTAHYLRSHQYVFGDSINQSKREINSSSAQALLKFFKGFLLTTTYKGIIVVVSQNVQQYLGYTELELLGQNVFNIVHVEDHKILKRQLMPRHHFLGPNGELLIPDEPDGEHKVAEALSKEKKRFVIRFKKLSQRSEPSKYVTCHIEGSLRKSDKACRGYNRCCQMVRRARVRSDNHCPSGNDVVFISVVRPSTETFMSESEMESFRMEYRTRHSIDGQILQCEQRIAIVTGYMTHEVYGVNAMNFMHRNDVRWVIIALREMYDKHRLYGESCYRLMTKNGQFIYMRTRGHLEVDPDTREVTSFVCTNTVVDENEGKQLNKLMKKKFTLMVNNNKEPPEEEQEEEQEVNDSQNSSLEDPKQLEKVILHLVTNLPSPQSEDDDCSDSLDGSEPSLRLAIIPPKKEKIVSGIEKIYSVLKNLKKDTNINLNTEKSSHDVVKSKIETNGSKNYSQSRPESPQILQTLSLISPTVLEHKVPTNNSLMDSLPKEPTVIFNEVINNTYSRYATKSPTSSECKPMYHIITNVPNLGNMLNGQPKLKTIKLNACLKIDQGTNLNLPANMESQITITQPSTSTGVKRPNEIAEDNLPKKKVTEAITKTDQSINEQNGRLSPSFEKFVYDAMLQEIDSNDFFENALDPSFADFLVPEDVQDILADIDEAQDNS